MVSVFVNVLKNSIPNTFKKYIVLFSIALLISICFTNHANAESVSLSTNAVYQGGTVTVYWSGFSGNVNVKLYTGSTDFVYATTTGAGSGQLDLVMTGYAVRADYWVRVELKTNPTIIYRDSGYFSVNNPSASVSPTSVLEGGTTTAYWSGFASTVNVRLYRSSSPLVYVTTTGAGSGQQDMVMSGYSASDYYRVKVELKANTNIYKWSNYFSVTDPPKPDLTISNVSFSNTVRNTGDLENVSVTVNRSNGQLNAGTYVLVHVYASSNTTITTADTYLGAFSTTDFSSNTLNSSGSLTRSKQFNMPSTCGNYYIGAIVDPTYFHAESNENNNSRAGNQMVVGKITVTNPNSSGITWYKSSPQTVTWTSCPNVTGNVQIQFYKGGSPSENITGSTSNDGTHPFTVSNSLQDGIDYQVGISAMSGQIWDYSDNNFTIIDEPPPDVPVNVGSTQISNGIRISWDSVSGVAGATPYMIYWGTDASVDENNKSGILTTDQTIYDHGGLDSGVIYYYRVKACNNTNCSELSDITSAQTPLADLTISIASIPANANVQQGNSYPITCTVSRTGGLLRPTTGYARVFVYMNQSTDSGTVTLEHRVLGDAGASSFDFSATALDDGSETQTINVPIPTTIEGPFYIHVKVDGPDYWTESDENNNWDSTQQDEELIVWRPGVPLSNEQMGVLARTWDDSNVYWIKYGKKGLLSNWDTFLNLGYTAAEVEWYGSGSLNGFALGKTILQDNDSFCYRSETDSTVYVIENGESHPFFQWPNFLGQGFTEEDIYWAKPEGTTWIQSIYPQVDAPMIRVEPENLNF